MKKISWMKSIVLVGFIALAAGCSEEPLEANGGADCGGCEEPPPGGGTIIVYCPDFVISDARVDAIVNGQRIEYRVTIKNIGNKTVYISSASDVSWQAYISQDGIIDSVPAGGAGFGGITLAPGQSWTKALQITFPSSVNIWNYPYLIVHLKVPKLIECRSDNNTIVHRMF
jgi:hypothetical protein